MSRYRTLILSLLLILINSSCSTVRDNETKRNNETVFLAKDFKQTAHSLVEGESYIVKESKTLIPGVVKTPSILINDKYDSLDVKLKMGVNWTNIKLGAKEQNMDLFSINIVSTIRGIISSNKISPAILKNNISTKSKIKNITTITYHVKTLSKNYYEITTKGVLVKQDEEIHITISNLKAGTSLNLNKITVNTTKIHDPLI